MAEKASVSLRTVSDYEACKGNPEMTSLFLIARALHMSLDDLCFWGSAADGRDTIHDLQSIVSTCSPYEAENVACCQPRCAICYARQFTKDAVNPNKEPALAKITPKNKKRSLHSKSVWTSECRLLFGSKASGVSIFNLLPTTLMTTSFLHREQYNGKMKQHRFRQNTNFCFSAAQWADQPIPHLDFLPY